MKWLLLLLWLPVVRPPRAWKAPGRAFRTATNSAWSLDADGTFELSADAQFTGEILREFAEYAQLAGTRPIESLLITVGGQYTVDGEKVSFQWAEWEASTNIGPFIEAMTDLAKGLAQALAAEAGISEEEYPAFEEEIVSGFLAEADPVDDIRVWLALGGIYDGEALTLGGVEFTHAATAVHRASWGQIKKGWE